MKGVAILVVAVLTAIGFGVGAEAIVGVRSEAVTGPRDQRCTSSHLSVMLGRGGVASGSVEQVVNLENLSDATCTLTGFPGLQMIDAAGRPLPTQVTDGSSISVPSIPERVVLLRPGSVASFDVGYADATGYGSASCPTAARVRVTLPGAGPAVLVSWRIQPYGGATLAKLRCGDITASPVYATG